MKPSSPILIIVPEGGSPTRFPGATTFFNLCSHCGLAMSDLEIVSISSPLFDSTVIASSAKVALCLGAAAFYRFTGLKISTIDLRGYLFSPSDFKPVERSTIKQIGVYKSSRKLADGTSHHQKGDPRFGKITETIPPTVPTALQWAIPTFTPEHVQKEALGPAPALKADIQRAIRVSSTSWEGPSAPIAMALPIDGPFLTIDIETIGFSQLVQRIGLTTSGTTAYSAPWGPESAALTQAFIDKAETIQGHNLAFDIPRLENEGIRFAGKARFDTMLAAVLLNPDMHKGLERVASLYADLRPWKHLAESDEATYNALDAFHTHNLASAQRDALQKTGMLSLFTDTIMPSTETLINMTRHGIRVDKDYLGKWQIELSSKLQMLSLKWNGFAPGVNPLSTPQLTHHLYNELHLTPRYAKRSNGGETLSIDENACRELKELHPDKSMLLETLMDIKKTSKLLSTYASIELSDDGCVHPSYLPASKSSDGGAASTGRLASSNPNIQNQTPQSKRLFIPHYEDWVFLEFDFSQIELRIAAALSDDKVLIKALSGDVHARTMDIIGCDRTRAKNLIYGTLYGAGPRKLARVLAAKGLQTSIHECQALQNALFRLYPDLQAWRLSVATEGISRRYLVNPFSRRRYFYGGSSSVPEMYDYLPQSTAADILWSLLRPLEQFALSNGGFFLTTTHDSGLFEFPRISLTTGLVDLLRSICEREWLQVRPGFRVPIKVKMGVSWDTMVEIEHE